MPLNKETITQKSKHHFFFFMFIIKGIKKQLQNQILNAVIVHLQERHFKQ